MARALCDHADISRRCAVQLAAEEPKAAGTGGTEELGASEKRGDHVESSKLLLFIPVVEEKHAGLICSNPCREQVGEGRLCMYAYCVCVGENFRFSHPCSMLVSLLTPPSPLFVLFLGCVVTVLYSFWGISVVRVILVSSSFCISTAGVPHASCEPLRRTRRRPNLDLTM